MKSSHKIVLISVLVLILGFVIYLFFRNSREKIGEFKQSQDGFMYSNEEVSLIFENSEQLDEESPINVFKINSNSDAGKYAEWQSSNAFLVSGKTEQFTGKLNVQFKITNKITEKIDDISNLPKRLFIVAQEKTKFGDKIVWTNNILPTELDTKQNLATSQFSFANFNHVATETDIYEVGFFLILFENNTMRMLSRASESDFSGSFEGIIDFPKPNLERALSVLDEIEHQWSKLPVLGFNVDKFEKPIQVRFVKLSSDEPVRVYQKENYTGRICIEVNSSIFLQKNYNLVDNEIKEKFKLVLGTNFFAAYEKSLSKYDWWNIAAAHWFQPIAMGNAFHLPANLVKNIPYITSSLLADENEDEDITVKKAISGAMLVSYLSVRTNNVKTIGKIFENLGLSTKPSLLLAIQKATDGKKLNKIYPDYLDFCIRKPETLFPKLSFELVDSKLEHDQVFGTIDQDGINWDIDEISDGNTCETGKAAALSFSYHIKPLSATILKIDLKFKNDELKTKFKGHGFSLTVGGNENSGAMVYKNEGKYLSPYFKTNKYLSPSGLKTLKIKELSSLYIILYSTEIPEKENQTIEKEIFMNITVD